MLRDLKAASAVKHTESGDWHIHWSGLPAMIAEIIFFQIQLKLKQNKLRNVRKFFTEKP